MREEVCAEVCFRLGDAGVITEGHYRICHSGLLQGVVTGVYCEGFLQAFFCRPNAGLHPPV